MKGDQALDTSLPELAAIAAPRSTQRLDGRTQTVELRLPKLDYKAGPFANREFSIRIRARQLR